MLKWPGRRRAQFPAVVVIISLIILGNRYLSRNPNREGDTSSIGTSVYHQTLDTIRPHESTTNNLKTFGFVDQVYVVSPVRNTERRKVIDTLSRALGFDFRYVNSTDNITPGEGREVVETILDRVRWQRPRIDERLPSQSEKPTPVEAPNSNAIHSAFPFEWSKDVMENEKDPLAKPLGISGADYWSLQPPHRDWERRNPLPKLTLDQRAAKLLQASRTNRLVKKTFIATTSIAAWHTHVRVLREIVDKSTYLPWLPFHLLAYESNPSS